ncbi:MAG TPA: winged helix-turn-helix transcriptional regulator [Candidatus Moranbacteria bacterium]|nr:winged helix-turn-helix transcriptional regulator [Candidatus Moranbacteria bacterium]HRY27601.1 winged helix-turn-helix transcriptional regulator [Candidatus Moranbacteria bacterium]HSA07830.1 winged helix-turn-helix transcriptional regulator [Candidatus Moranbacteria bacterium]
MNLTELDKKILFELDKDGRVSFSEIARTLGSTPQVIKYHAEQMQEKGIIKHFWAFTDYDKADYSFFWGYWLKFGGLTKEKESEMYADFNANKYIPIIMRSDGYADVMLAIIARDVFHQTQILQDIFSKYGQYITMSDIFVGLGFIKFPRTYLVGKENEFQKFAVSGGTTEKIKLSENDRKIISLLLQDGRMELTRIAKILGVSVGLVHKHFNKLEQSGVITKIACTLDYQKAGLLFYRVVFKIVQFDQKRIDDLYKFCCLHPNIINYVKGMGNWDLMLDIEVENREAIRDLIREMKNNFKDVIRQVEINEIYQMDKFTQMAIEYPDLLKNYEKKIKTESLQKIEKNEEPANIKSQPATEEDIYY